MTAALLVVHTRSQPAAYSPLLWGSLANLLWWRACRRAGVDVPLVRVALLGLGVSAGCVLTGTTAIWAVGLLTA